MNILKYADVYFSKLWPLNRAGMVELPKIEKYDVISTIPIYYIKDNQHAEQLILLVVFGAVDGLFASCLMV